MSLTVLNVSFPLAPVSAGTAGGAEQVLGMLDAALVRAGHRSLVIAPEGSHCAGLLVPIRAIGSSLDEQAKHDAEKEVRAALDRVLRRFAVDVVHLHGLDFLNYLPAPGVPVVVTLHLPPEWYPGEAFQIARPHTYLVCVSPSQFRNCPPQTEICEVIENGVSLRDFHPGKKKAKYILGLGRICPEKAFDVSMDAANHAGFPFWLAGTVFGYETHREYFEKLIKPRLVKGNRFLGSVGGRRKRALLAGAKCLLISSRAPETSSLAAMEALACGTPVVAFRTGALGDIVEHGRTGFLVNDKEEMVSAIRCIDDIDPKGCRRAAELRFSAEVTSQKYLNLYSGVAELHPSNVLAGNTR